jgi:3-deoxy-manno-octulosonate cytidylyltransferase (CMP-KDO synthetase)
VKVNTLCQPITHVEDLFNPNVVKVVMNRRNYAMYFSRAVIPWERDQFESKEKIAAYKNDKVHWQHIGIYAYKVDFLQEYIEWSSCRLEEIEALEQLRILWNGVRIHVVIAENKILPEVNTEADLNAVRIYTKEHGSKF